MADDSTPAGFSSPMGGSGKKASAAAAAALNDLKSSAKSYADNMERGAKAAERAAHAQAKSGAGSHYIGSVIGQGSPAGGSTSNGGGARVPDYGSTKARDTALRATIAGPPAGFPGARPNGGGAAIPAAPGAPSYEETRARSAAIGADPDVVGKKRNGGGASFGGAFRKASPLPSAGAPSGMSGAAAGLGRGFGTAIGAAIGGMVAATPTYSSFDYMANRFALNTPGRYSKQGGADAISKYLGGAFSNASEMTAQGTALLNGGFTPGSSGFSAQASAIRSMASLDPQAAARAGQTALSFQGPQTFNTMNRLGIQTMGQGGAPKTPDQIAKQMYQRMASNAGIDPSKAPSVAQVAAYFGPTGSMQTTGALNGMNQDQIDALHNSLSESARLGRFATDKDSQSRNRGKNPFGDTMQGSNQDREKGSAKIITASLKEFADGYISANKKIGSALEDLGNAIHGLPKGIKEAIFGTAGVGGAMTHGGGAVGNSVFGGIAGGLASAGGHLLAAGMRGGGGGAAGASGSMLRGSMTRAVGGRLLKGGAVALAGDLIGGGITHIGKHNGKDNVWADVGGTAVKGAAYGAMLGPEGAAVGAALGGLYGLASNKGWLPWGDGPGRPASSGGSHGSASFPGIGAASFRGQEWGDGPGSDSAQAAAQKQRGGETVGVLEEMLKGYKGGAKVTSTTRHGSSGVTVSGNVSYHATGNAIDIAANTPGSDSPELLSINKYFAQYGAGLNELIYAGPGGQLIKDGKSVGRGFYGKDVMDIHHNHVHVAATAGMLKNLKGKGKSKGFFGKIASGISSAVHGVEHLFGGGKSKPATKTGSQPKPSSLGGLLGATALRGGYSQAAVLEQLLHGLGPSFGSTGSHPTTFDPGEATAGGTKASSGTSKVTSMPAGSARENALTIIKVAKEMGISKRGAVIGIATAEQESNLINLHSGDRDSQGLFQQRPSQGWGSVAEVTNPEHAAHSFFAALRGTDYNHLPLTVAAQKVQRSGFPDAYAKWEGTAQGIVDQSHVYGDGPGRPGAMAMTTTADVPTPQAHTGRGAGGGGNMTVHSRGGSSITIGKVEVHLTSPQVSPTEARRIGKMVVDEIAQQARMKEMSR